MNPPSYRYPPGLPVGYLLRSFADRAAGVLLMPDEVAQALDQERRSKKRMLGAYVPPVRAPKKPKPAAARKDSGWDDFWNGSPPERQVDAQWQRWGSRRPGAQEHIVFEPYQAVRFHRAMNRLHRDERVRLAPIYEDLAAKGHIRQVAEADLMRLQRLARLQPHMGEVIAFVRSHLELAACSARPQPLPPILLAGAPGIGKTYFAQQLAIALDAPLRIQRMDCDITDSFLLGSDRKWANSQHGALFDMVVLGRVANPVFLLDDLDKGTRRDNRPQAALYSLLERSARQVRDISLDFEFDASLVTWILTVNDPSMLDEPLRSRLREFHIRAPDARQSLTVAEEVMRLAILDLEVPGFSLEHPRLHRFLAHLPARAIRQLTQDAVARAVAAGAQELREQHLAPELLQAWGHRPPPGSLH